MSEKQDTVVVKPHSRMRTLGKEEFSFPATHAPIVMGTASFGA